MQKISIKSFVTRLERETFSLWLLNELVSFATAVNEYTSFTDSCSRDTVFPCIKNSQYYGNVPIFKNRMNFYR